MSILDGPFTDKETMQGAIAFAQTMTREMLPDLDEDTRRIIELTADGSSLGDALGITKEQKAALLDMGCRLIQVQQLEKATDVLMRLNQLDPLEERAMYALGVVCQMRGEWHKAAQMYLQFLALDATNPIGYLRLGECLLAAKEFAEAHAAFSTAKEFAEEGKGQPGNAEEARRMLEIPEIAAAGGAARQ
jgi:tetratricopeptide (TPR) repeat protein